MLKVLVCREKLELYSCQNHEQTAQALALRTVNPMVQGSILPKTTLIFFCNAYSSIFAHIDMQNKTLIISLCHKVYCSFYMLSFVRKPSYWQIFFSFYLLSVAYFSNLTFLLIYSKFKAPWYCFTAYGLLEKCIQ